MNRALGVQFILLHYSSFKLSDRVGRTKTGEPQRSPDPLAALLQRSPTIPPSDNWYQQEVPRLMRLIAVCCSMRDCCVGFVRTVRSIWAVMHQVCGQIVVHIKTKCDTFAQLRLSYGRYCICPQIHATAVYPAKGVPG